MRLVGGAVLRPDARTGVERAEADRDFGPIRPRASKKARAADGAKRLRHAALGPVDLNELLAPNESKGLPGYPALSRGYGPVKDPFKARLPK